MMIMESSGAGIVGMERYDLFTRKYITKKANMKRMRRIEQSDLLKEEHSAVQAVFNAVYPPDVLDRMKDFSEGIGFDGNLGACTFWDEFEEWEKENEVFFDGVEFYVYFVGPTIVSFRDTLYYFELVGERHLEDFPEDADKVHEYVEAFKKRFVKD